jgi:hypothetical protein
MAEMIRALEEAVTQLNVLLTGTGWRATGSLTSRTDTFCLTVSRDPASSGSSGVGSTEFCAETADRAAANAYRYVRDQLPQTSPRRG